MTTESIPDGQSPHHDLACRLLIGVGHVLGLAKARRSHWLGTRRRLCQTLPLALATAQG